MITVLLWGCARPPEAPQELDDLSHYLFREWANEDERVMQEGMANLQAFMDGVDFDKKVLDRSWELSSITDETRHDLDHPGRAGSNTLGVGISGLSEWPVDDHRKMQLHDDQLPTEPSAKDYVRRFLEGEDCFADRECILHTDNTITRQNLIMQVEFDLKKDFDWFAVGEDGPEAIVARSWMQESAFGENGKTKIFQSYSLDVWMPKGNKTRRYHVLWTETEVPGASDSVMLGTIKSGTNDIFEAGDKAIEDLFH